MSEQSHNKKIGSLQKITSSFAVGGLLALASVHFDDSPKGESKAFMQNETSSQEIEKAIEDTLNSGGEYDSSVVKDGFSFIVTEDKRKETGIETIYNPLLINENTVGYISVNQETKKADVVLVPLEDGILVQMQERPDSEVVGQYGLVISEGPTGTVAALNDKVGTFVGRTSPYMGS